MDEFFRLVLQGAGAIMLITWPFIHRAALGQKAREEREACAKVAEDFGAGMEWDECYCARVAEEIAAKIRERSNG